MHKALLKLVLSLEVGGETLLNKIWCQFPVCYGT